MLDLQVRRFLRQACLHSVAASSHPAQLFTLPEKCVFFYSGTLRVGSQIVASHDMEAILLAAAEVPSVAVPAAAGISTLQQHVRALATEARTGGGCAYGPWLLDAALLWNSLVAGPNCKVTS